MLCDYLTTVRLYGYPALLKHLMGSRIVIALLYCLNNNGYVFIPTCADAFDKLSCLLENIVSNCVFK